MRTRLKALTSFILTFTFLIAALSGTALFLSPKGRVANWMNWTWLGLLKDEWTDIHTVFVTIFLIGGLIHLFVFNWSVFWAYIVKKANQEMRFKWELIAALALIPVLWFGTVYKIRPIYSIVALGTAIDLS